MKKTAIITLATMMLAAGFNQLSAQRVRDYEYFPRNEIYVQYGIPSVIEITSVLNRQKFENNNIVGKGQKLRMTGAAGFGYNFSLNQNVSIGLFGGISSVGSDMIKQDDSKDVLFSTDITSYLGMLSAHWLFLQDGPLEVSSGVYLGADYSSKEISNIASGFGGAPKNSTSTTFAYHLTALKVRYGETFAVFGELGFGHRGIFSAGISLKF